MTHQFTPDQVLGFIIQEGQKMIFIKSDVSPKTGVGQKKKKFKRFPDDRLTCLAQRIYDFLLSLNNTEGYLVISNGQLAQKLRCSEQSVSTRLQELELKKLIERKYRIVNTGTERRIYLFDAPHEVQNKLF